MNNNTIKNFYYYTLSNIGDEIWKLRLNKLSPQTVIMSSELYNILDNRDIALTNKSLVNDATIFGLKVQIDSSLKGMKWKLLCSNSDELKRR